MKKILSQSTYNVKRQLSQFHAEFNESKLIGLDGSDLVINFLVGIKLKKRMRKQTMLKVEGGVGIAQGRCGSVAYMEFFLAIPDPLRWWFL